jgi:hypothetical protein
LFSLVEEGVCPQEEKAMKKIQIASKWANGAFFIF